ncbi:LamG domain-containing protein [Modestobacter sp. URMC 112]
MSWTDDAHRAEMRRARVSWPLPRAVVAATCAAVVTAALAVAGPGGAWASFTGTTVNTGSELRAHAAFPDYRTAVLNSNPVVYHPFDDPYGSSAAGAIRGTAGTYNGAAVVSSVPAGAIATSAGGPRRAVRFSPGAFAAANSTTTLSAAAVNTQQLTLEAWVRTGQGGAVVSLFPEGAPTTPGRAQLYVNGSGMACVGLTLEGAALQEVCGSDPEDTRVWTSADQASPVWRHVAAVIEPIPSRGAGTEVSVYVDGSVVYDHQLTGTWPQTLSGRWRVGSAPITADTNAARPAPDTWSGDIDEVAVYATALPPPEISKHHQLGLGNPAGSNYATYIRGLPNLQLYWQLEEQPSATARSVADASPGGTSVGTYHSYPDLELAGAPTGTTPTSTGVAVGLWGVAGISAGGNRSTPAAFSAEVWFKSSGGTGPLVGFTPTAAGNVPDRAVYLTATGDLAFGMSVPRRTLTAGRNFRDGQWHLVTATMGAGGRMSLYVDGELAAADASAAATASDPGLWRWGGGGNYTSYPTQPGAPLFTGLLDEASVYDVELSAEDVAVHWGAKF